MVDNSTEHGMKHALQVILDDSDITDEKQRAALLPKLMIFINAELQRGRTKAYGEAMRFFSSRQQDVMNEWIKGKGLGGWGQK